MPRYNDDYYFEVNKELFERKTKADEYRNRMVDELSVNNMTRIIFNDLLNKKSDCDVIALAEKYLY